MGVYAPIYVRQCPARRVAVAAGLTFAPVKASLLPHERVRIFLVFLAHSRMLRQELLQVGMVIHKLLVVYERRILTQLLSYVGMAVHEPIHLRQFPTRHVAIAAGLIFAPVKALFLPDEPVRILTQLFAYFRMLLQILLQVT